MSAHLTRPAYTPTTLLASPSGRRRASAPARPAVPIGLRFHATATLKIQPRPRSFFSPPPRAGLRLVEPGEADADVPYTTPEQANAFAAALADPALCARIFAAKEAVLKALGCGLAGGWSWRDVEITSDFRVVLSGGAGRLAQERSMRKIHIVQSCSGGYAMALAIAEA